MIQNRLALFFVLIAWLAIPGELCCGQVAPPEGPANRIVNGSKQITVLNDLETVAEEVGRFFVDIGYGILSTSIDQLLPFDPNSGLSGDSGMILYGDPFSTDSLVADLQVSDREKLSLLIWEENRINANEEVTFHLNSADPFIPFQKEYVRFDYGMISGRRFLAFGNKKEAEAKRILAAPRLELDETSQEIVNTAGIALINQIDENEVKGIFDAPIFVQGYEDFLTDAELKWLSEFSEVLGSSRLGLIGLKYHDKVLQIRSRVQVGTGKSLDELIDPTTDRDWQPELGMESEQLVLSAAVQMEAFRSSAAARAFPQLLLRESSGVDQYEFLEGKMLRILAELSGDSWNELSAARVGLYQNEENENAGQLVVIGVVDARSPDDVLAEMRRLSRLTSPESLSVKAAEREDELLRLVEELASDDDNVSDRATTRLVLAGNAAISAMEKGARTWNPTIRERAERILQRIRSGNNLDGKSVVDPGFWTTLNPGLRLEESTGEIAGHATHTIHITPDPSNTKDEIAEAAGVMQALFGNQWNEVLVVQVRNHFVFMIGSDRAMLKRITENVAARTSTLTQPFSDAKLAPIHGQIQICVNASSFLNLAGINDWFGVMNEINQAEGLGWIGLDFESRAANVDALIPVKQFIPFIRIGIGL